MAQVLAGIPSPWGTKVLGELTCLGPADEVADLGVAVEVSRHLQNQICLPAKAGEAKRATIVSAPQSQCPIS
jgi:hypothetical protein